MLRLVFSIALHVGVYILCLQLTASRTSLMNKPMIIGMTQQTLSV